MALVVAALALVAAVLALVLAGTLFSHFSSNHDEPVYVFQAETLEEGHLSVPAGDLDPFFRPWLHGEHDGHLFSVFQPVWPLVLAASETLTGTSALAHALVAAGGVVLLYLFTVELLGRRAPAVVAAGLLAVSPFFLVLTGTRLSYPLALVLALGFGWCLLRAARTGGFGWWMGAGAWWGVLAVARPLDALLFASIALGAGVVAVRRGRLPAPGRSASAVAAGAAPFLLLGGLYNWAVTGAPWRFPLQAAGGNNDFGFGTRQLTPTSPTREFAPSNAVSALGRNLSALPHWSPGGLVILPLAVAGAVLLWRRGQRWQAVLLGAIALVVPIGNLPYWGNVFVVAGRRILGPHYYLAVLVPLLVCAGIALVALARRSKVATALVALVMVGATAAEAAPKIDINREIACTNRHPVEEVEAVVDPDDPAIVLVPVGPDGPALMHLLPALGNPPDLDDDLLYANDLGPRTWELADRFPDRRLYRLSMRVPPDGEILRRVPVVDPLRRVAGPDVRVPFEAVNEGGDPLVSLYVDDGQQRQRVVVDRQSVPGRSYAGAWVVGPDGARLEVGGRPVPGAEAPLPLARTGQLRLGVAFGDASGDADTYESRLLLRPTPGGVELIGPGEGLHRVGGEGAFWFPDDSWRSWRVEGPLGGARRFPVGDPCEHFDIKFRPPD